MEHLFPIRVFVEVPVDATDAVESDPVNMQFYDGLVAFLIRAASAGGTADVKIEYRQGWDQADGTVAWGEYADTAELEDTTAGLATPEGWNAIPTPTLLAPWVQFRVTGVGANPADTIVSADLWAKELF